jgi:hypothetical protein
MSSTTTRARLNTSGHRLWHALKRPWGNCGRFDKHQTQAVEVSLHVQLQLNALGALSVIADKNTKD